MCGGGDAIKGFSGVEVLILSPGKNNRYRDSNDSSIVVKFVERSTGKSVLFCGDVKSATIKELLCFGEFLRSDIIKIPHHGQIRPDLVVRRFLRAVDPKIAVITNKNIDSVNAELLEFLDSEGICIHITGEEGTVIL